MPRKVKVAVVGSGLAGLTAAYLLTKPSPQDNDVEFEVHLFEKSPMLGMDSSSISVPIPGARDQKLRIDVPMRSFQGGYYPQLIALYKRLGVSFRTSNFSYSFSLLSPPSATRPRQINTTLIYNGLSGLAGLSIPSSMEEQYYHTKGQATLVRVVARAWTLWSFFLVTALITICYLRMLWLSLPFRRVEGSERMTFGEWAENTAPTSVLARWAGADVAWRDFTHSVLLPLFSAVCTAPAEDVLRHPVEEFLGKSGWLKIDYIWLTLGTHHYVTVNGVKDVVSRLSSTVKNIYLSSTISAISPDPKDPQIASIYCNTPQGSIIYSGFHHIIFATQATRAVPLLSSYQLSLPLEEPKRQAVGEQIRCLKTFEYRNTVVINHTDPSLLPDNVKDRRELNLIYWDQDQGALPHEKPNVDCVPISYTMATHALPLPRGYAPWLPRIYQTTNPIIPPENKLILSVAKLERAVVTMESKEALKGLYKEEGRRWWQCASEGTCRLGELQGAGRLSKVTGPGIWICGSFAYAGIPLLEGCVVSARSVVEQGIWKTEGVESESSPW